MAWNLAWAWESSAGPLERLTAGIEQAGQRIGVELDSLQGSTQNAPGGRYPGSELNKAC